MPLARPMSRQVSKTLCGNASSALKRAGWGVNIRATIQGISGLLGVRCAVKVKYKFPVKSISRITDPFPLILDDIEYVISTDSENKINMISVELRADDDSLWPTLTETPSLDTKFTIKMHSPHLEKAQQSVRAIEGVLSSFGVQSISWNNPEEIYIPESEEEKESLGVFGMSVKRGRANASDKAPIPFSIVAATIIRAKDLTDFEIPLAFYRKGTNDAYEDRHIEACVNFLFMLETLFANGQFKTKSVISEYSARVELVQAIRDTQADDDLVKIAYRWGASHGSRLEDVYKNSSAENVVAHLVGLRGLLHHHTQRHQDRWHPDKHDDFLADALFLQFVCSKISLGLFSETVFSEETNEIYKECYRRVRQSGGYT